MSLQVFTHLACARHQPPPGHPERPERLQAALAGVERVAGAHMLQARPADREQLRRVHAEAYLDRLDALAPREHAIALDADTFFGADTGQAALLAAGAACQAVDAVFEHPSSPAFAVIRPPGHHAEAGRAMGFCYYNNIAVAAAHALAEYPVRRVAICDFDVHHGNGTEAIFAGNEAVRFASSHQWPLYPGTGDPGNPPADNIINATLPEGSGGEAFRALWRDHLLPRIDGYAPELILVSAGFDAHRADPLAGLRLEDDDYRWIGRQLRQLADRHADGRLAATLEGGYDLDALENSVYAFGEGVS